MFADWQAGEPDIAMGLGVQGICSGEAGAPSSAHGGTDGGAPDGAAPPHPSLGQSPSTPALPPDLCAPRGDEEQQPLQLEAAAGQERSAASGESQQQQQEAQPQQPQQVPEAQPPLTPEQLQTLRWMTAALEGDLVTAARALRAVEAALSGVVPPECFNFLDGSSISSSRKGSIGSSRNSNKLGFGIPGLGAAQQAAPPLDVQQQPTPPRLRPWWLQLPGSWPHEQAYAAFERRAITYARHLEGLLKAALEWTTPFGWLPVSLRVMPPGCDPHKVEQELAAVYVQALEENDEAGRSWPDLCHAMARGLHAAYNGSAAPAGTAGVDTAGAAGASAAVTAAGADAEPMPRPPAPEASAEGGGGMAEVAAAPGAAEGDAAPVAAPAPSSSCGGGEQQVMLADQQEEKTTAAAETVPPGLRQMRKKADSRGRAQREVRPVKRLQRLTEEERVKQLHDKEQAEWEAQELKIRACAPVLAAALTPGICSAAARRQILRLLLWDPCSDKPPSEVAASSNSANAGEQTGRGAGADLLSPWRVPQEAAAEEAEARAEEVLISRFLADVYPPVKERWRWVLHAAARGHKDSLQVAGRALAGALLLQATGRPIRQADPVLCAATVIVMTLLQAAGQDFPTPTRVYTALATIPLPPPPQCLWAELRPSMLQQALPTDTLVSPLSNTHLLDTAFRLSRQPEVFTAWQPAIFALRTSESVETLVGRHSQLLGMYELMQWLSILAPETEGANPCNPLVVRSLQTGTLDIILQLLLLPGNMVETSGSCLDGPARAAEQQHQQQQQPQAQEPAQPGQPKQSEQLEQPRLEQAAEQQQEQPVVWMWPEGLAGITVQPGAAALLLMSALHDPQLQSRLQPACGAGGDSSGSGSGGSGIAGSGSAGSGSAGSGESSSGGGSAGQAATTEAAELQATCVATQAARAVSRANGCLMFYPYLSEVVGALALCAPGPDDDGAGAGVGTVGGGGAQASSSGADGPSSDAQAAADGASCPVAMQGPGGCGNAACTYCQALLRPNAIDIRRVALPPGARARLPALAARLPVAARVVPDSGSEQSVDSAVRAFGLGAGAQAAGSAAGTLASASACEATVSAVARLQAVGAVGCQRLLMEIVPEVRKRMAAHGRDVGLVPVAVLDYGTWGAEAEAGGGGRDCKAGRAAIEYGDCAARSAAADVANSKKKPAGGSDGEPRPLLDLDGDYGRALQALLPLAPLHASERVMKQVQTALVAQPMPEPEQPQQQQQEQQPQEAPAAADGLSAEAVGDLEQRQVLARLLAFAHDGGQPLKQAFEDALSALQRLHYRLRAEADAEAAEALVCKAEGEEQGLGAGAGREDGFATVMAEGATGAAVVAQGSQVKDEQQTGAEGACATWHGRRRFVIDVLLLECVPASRQQELQPAQAVQAQESLAQLCSGLLAPGARAFLSAGML